MFTLLQAKPTKHQFNLQLVGLLELHVEIQFVEESLIGLQRPILQVPKLFMPVRNGNLLGAMVKMLQLKIFGDTGHSSLNAQPLHVIVLPLLGQALITITQEIVLLRETFHGPLLPRTSVLIQIQVGITQTGVKLRAAKPLHLEIAEFTMIGLAEPDIDSEIELLIKDLFGKLNGITTKLQQSLQELNVGELSTESNHALQLAQPLVIIYQLNGTSRPVTMSETELLLLMETSMLLKTETLATTQNTTTVIGTLH